MTETRPNSQFSIEQATDTSQILTEAGIAADSNPFIAGSPVSKDYGGFYGRNSLVAEMREKLIANGIVVLEGSHRTGRTSLLRFVTETLTHEGVVQAGLYLDLGHTHPDQLLSDVKDRIARRTKDDPHTTSPKAVIALNQLGSYDPKQHEQLLDVVDHLRSDGHMILLSVIGDLHSRSPSELPPVTKERIVRMAGNSVIINRLFTDEEMWEVLTQRREPLFTEPMIRFLIREAGGNPYLANALAQDSLDLLTIDKVEPIGFIDELRDTVRDHGVLDHFAPTVDIVLSAGFDPVTWQWHGEGKIPDVEVYRNMLPAKTSVVFQDWLKEHLQSLDHS